jgi:1,4-dihydroxy-2-naphthoate octaprenyltransferase
MESDRQAGKITLANALGRRVANWEYWLLVGLCCPSLLLLVWADRGLWPATLLPMFSLIKAIPLMRMYVAEQDPKQLSLGVRRTAGLHLQFGSLSAVGLLLAAALRHL